MGVTQNSYISHEVYNYLPSHLVYNYLKQPFMNVVNISEHGIHRSKK